mmetsp:Transcript_90806/g.253699  ORF Transcript_90806/g.253699 Transcript_90806/m.253699 type:complete len:184 (+) Transcript_90806:32-583(+)
MSRGVPVRITQGVEPQHNRVAFMRAMAQFGEVVYCRKPPYSGIPGEDYVNIGFATASAAERAYEELKANRVFVDGVLIGVGPANAVEDRGSRRSRSRQRRSRSQGRGKGGKGQTRGAFKQRHDERSPSPRTLMREALMTRKQQPQERRRSRSRSRSKSRRRRRSSRSRSSRKRSSSRRRSRRR